MYIPNPLQLRMRFSISDLAKHKMTKYIVGSIVGSAVAIISAPIVVTGLGFGAGGIVAGSIASSMMSFMAPTAAAGVVATLQSVGAVGIGASGSVLLGAVGSASGIITTIVGDKLIKMRNRKMVIDDGDDSKEGDDDGNESEDDKEDKEAKKHPR